MKTITRCPRLHVCWDAPLAAVPKCDVVIACTGYRNAFPIFLGERADEVFCAASGLTYRQLAAECANPRLLYKQCIHPSCPDGSLAQCGFARPAFGSIPPCSEMQVFGSCS